MLAAEMIEALKPSSSVFQMSLLQLPNFLDNFNNLTSGQNNFTLLCVMLSLPHTRSDVVLLQL